MNVIYVGTVPPNHIVDEIKRLGSYMDYATLTFQNALVSGLDYWYPNMRIVSAIRVDEYPKVKKIIFKPENYSHKDKGNKDDRFVRIVNLPLLKRFFLFIDKRREIKQMIYQGEQNVVIMYSLPSSQLLAVATLRKHLFKTCLVIPDLPEYMSDNRGFIWSLAKSIDRKLIEWSIRRIDTFVLLSKHMANRLPIKGKTWKVMEGIYNQTNCDIEPSKEFEQYKAIMYSGDLSLRYGIKDLLDAFELISDKSYRLILCGNGNGKQLIIEYANKDPRIIYLGVLEHEKVLSLQKGVKVLVNPRHKSEDYTRYSFPSKTMEYLASETPVIMHHLDCIPPDYDEYINYIEKETPESLRDIIIEVCERDCDVAKERAKKAAIFIKEQKNAVVQATKIVELIGGK